MNWQAIETAPKDRRVLLWDDTGAFFGSWIEHSINSGWEDEYGWGRQPSHWCEITPPTEPTQ